MVPNTTCPYCSALLLGPNPRCSLCDERRKSHVAARMGNDLIWVPRENIPADILAALDKVENPVLLVAPRRQLFTLGKAQDIGLC